MPNRLYNKQVSAKGYKRGGGVSESSKKQELASRPKKREMAKKFLKTVTSLSIPAVGGAMAGKKTIDKLRAKKMGGGMMMERPMMKKGGPSKKPKIRKIGVIGVGKAKDYPGIKKIIKMNKQGKKRFGMKMGGALKPVDPKTQKGLSKLPTKVRNKMGYMKKGGKVNGK